MNWPVGGPSSTALVFDEELPLPDSTIDRFLLVHLLEHSENPRETLKEIWRVLAPGGRLVIVVPNRRGVWARFEHTPFGTGRPFSRGQLTELLRETNFTPSVWSEALCFPPSKRRWMMRFHQLLERTGRRLWPIFSGVVIVEAQKRLYQGIPVAQRASRRVFVPVLSPQGATRRRDVGPEWPRAVVNSPLSWPSVTDASIFAGVGNVRENRRHFHRLSVVADAGIGRRRRRRRAAGRRSRSIWSWCWPSTSRARWMPTRPRCSGRAMSTAISHPDFIRADQDRASNGRIALSYFEWAGEVKQEPVIPWQVIDSRRERCRLCQPDRGSGPMAASAAPRFPAR